MAGNRFRICRQPFRIGGQPWSSVSWLLAQNAFPDYYMAVV
jgi:hypothetical protein